MAHGSVFLELFLVVLRFLRSLSSQWASLGVSRTNILPFCFRPILTQRFMAMLSKGFKLDNFESYNSIKLSFLNIWGLCFNFVECESFLESDSLDIFTICETNLNVFFFLIAIHSMQEATTRHGVWLCYIGIISRFGSVICVIENCIFFMEVNSYVGNKVELTWSYQKKKHKRLQHTENLFKKNLQLKHVCFF